MRRSCAHDFFPRKRGMNHYSARKKRERRGESEGVTPDKFAEREGGGRQILLFPSDPLVAIRVEKLRHRCWESERGKVNKESSSAYILTKVYLLLTGAEKRKCI